MDKRTQYVALAVAACLAVLAGGWFLLVSPKRAQAADLSAQAESQLAANAQLTTRLQVLKSQAKDLPKQQARIADIAAKIPHNPALPSLIRALVKAGTDAGVELVSITPGTATAAAAAPNAAPVAPGTPAAKAPAPSALSVIPLALNVAGGYFELQQFVASLEQLPRSMRVNNLTVTPGKNPVKPKATDNVDDGLNLTATISGQVFMAPNRPAPVAAAAGTTPVAPGAVPAAPVN